MPSESDAMRVFSSYEIQSCLYDAERVELFRRAIFDVVRPGMVVADGGSGTGLLGLFAAQAGAAKVSCIEINADYVDVIRENAKRNGFADVIDVVHADASRCDLDGPVDVIVCELLSAGFFYEPQLQVVKNLRRFLRPGGTIIPRSMENTVELIRAQESLYGLVFNYDTRFRALPDDGALTRPAVYQSAAFHGVESPAIDTVVRVRAHSSGLANAVRVGYRVELTEGVWADQPTEYMLNPQVVFLREPVSVRPGAAYDVSLTYQASASPLAALITVGPAATDLEHRVTDGSPTDNGRP